MKTIAIDIDSTLYDFSAEVREAFFEMAIAKNDKALLKGAYHSNFEWRELADRFDKQVVLDAIHWVHDRQLEQIPFKNAVKVCNKLSDNLNIKYVTTRRQKYHISTLSWLRYHRFPKGDLICAEHDKTEHLTDCQYLIDDRPRTLVDFLSNFAWKEEHKNAPDRMDRKAFGLWTAYNRNLTDIRGLYLAPTWRGIEFYLQRKGLLSAGNT